MRYSENIDYLIAAVMYLGTSTAAWARTAPNMALDLALDEKRLRAVLTGFPGLFRRSRQPNEAGEHYYSLQARYALRTEYGRVERSTSIPPLPLENVKLVYDFILRSAEDERTARRTKVGNGIAVAAAVISSLAAVGTALMGD